MIDLIAFAKAGLWDSVKKWLKIALWVCVSASIASLIELLAGIKFQDATILGFVITASMFKVGMTALINGFLAGLLKWSQTKVELSKK